MPPRPSYKTFVVERQIGAPRAVVWQALLDFLFDVAHGYAVPGDPPPHGPGAEIHFRLGRWDLVERTLTLEPPWRRVYEIVAGAAERSLSGRITPLKPVGSPSTGSP